MKLVKKLFLLALFALSAVALVGCDKKGANTLIVGTPEMNQDFISGWDNNAYDMYVRDLIHGYGTLVETELGEYVWDLEAVLAKAPETQTDSEGNKTYKFTLQEDLKWNNGEPINAKHYVANMLLYSSAEWEEISTAGATAGYDLVGYAAYHDGDGSDDYTVLNVPFEGVRLLGDYQFSFTIAEESLPYFYEKVLVAASPIYYPNYLPGYDVKDDGEGAYFTTTDTSKKMVDLLEETVLDTETGQRYMPLVTCGPYKLVSFANQVATLELNKHFKTNYEGKKPTIKNIQIKAINQETDVEQVIAGTVDIVNGVIEAEKINAAREDENTDMVSYPRNGYGYLGFANYWGPTKYAEVRRGLGYLVDRQKFLTQYLGGFGSLVNGPYGEAQWFYQETKDELEEKLTNYVYDINKANEELDKSPYKFESDGVTPWDASKAKADGSYLRYNANKEPLSVYHCGTPDNPVTDILQMEFEANAWKAGVKYRIDIATFDVLLQHYGSGYSMSDTERKYHMFNLATGYTSAYDPYYYFHSEWAGKTNPLGVVDSELDELTVKLRRVDSNDKDKFKEIFVQVVDRWNEILPTLPLYSNEYFDIYNKRVKGLKTSPVWTWANDICDLTLEK
ncbi:MAG TPA: ABC transporter substrate-binding protein [Acholeplasmataceae bacterium]|nr:ABC transporter substrate-binding protein [Acholeplasmataceae bacterium]